MSSPNATSAPPSLEAVAGTLSAEDKQWAMLAHLSAIATLCVLGLPFLGPLLIWVFKGEQSKYVEEQAKEALNFQLNIFIYLLVSIPLLFILLGFLTLFAAVLYSIIMAVIAGMKAKNGEPYRYPFSFRLIKGSPEGLV
ncbi:MAG: DUF4870 domain-containing protein [Gemmataceae bacterium]